MKIEDILAQKIYKALPNAAVAAESKALKLVDR